MKPAELYLQVREKEGRLYGDDSVRRLPEAPAGHPLAGEWRARAASCARLLRYLEQRPGNSRPLAILELGCGNGWLSSRLASIPAAQVWGVDRDTPELAQAARLFGRGNLAFLAADIFQAPFPARWLGAIILASAIQYFPDLPALLRALRLLLKPGGEIHLLDSPLYEPGELPAARERTRAYYAALGFPEMAGHYFHHSRTALDGFSPHWLYHPGSLGARWRRSLGKADSPFPWVCLRK